MSSGALGRGSYRSVVAGTRPRFLPTYYPSSYELIRLHEAQREVTRNFAVRDKVFDNKFPGCAQANGIFKLVPLRRQVFHNKDVVESIRRRSIWAQRVQQQRAVNAAILQRAAASMTDAELEERFTLSSPDADVYFNPAAHTATNTWPDFWHHPSRRHVVPNPQWRRHPELDGITRVNDQLPQQASGY